jgi:hypothetical protein
VEALPRCREWLERLERGARLVVNLRPETETEILFAAEEQAQANEARYLRHRLAGPDTPPKRSSTRGERAALREALGLPPYERG